MIGRVPVPLKTTLFCARRWCVVGIPILSAKRSSAKLERAKAQLFCDAVEIGHGQASAGVLAPPLAYNGRSIVYGGLSMATSDPSVGPVKGAERREVAGVVMDIARVGSGRVKRVVYPAGFRWSRDMKALVGSDYCMHAHVGFLVSGRIQVRYADGCTVDFVAPQPVQIDPGHDGTVPGDEPAVLIEFDFEGDTVEKLELPASHRHV